MSYFDIFTARECYKQGGNVTEHLRRQHGTKMNTPQIIEIAYDLQAGSYIEFLESNHDFCMRYSAQLTDILKANLEQNDTIMDIGTGELTTFSLILEEIHTKIAKAYAFDISWSRLSKGIQFAEKRLGDSTSKLVPFMANIETIPLPSKSIDITTSNHALEPNGGNLEMLMMELFRVTRKKLVLFEPSYETNCQEGKRRMDSLGYIKGLESVVAKLGGKVVDFTKLQITSNALNPTACFVIEPPEVEKSLLDLGDDNQPTFTIPGSNIPLSLSGNFLVSKESGLVFPILGGIPVLKRDSAILATAYDE